MTEKEVLLNSYLLRIANNLDISESMREEAEKSYLAVGKWLGHTDENSDVRIMVQGSFGLGTVIRPVSDKDEYDIDLVCLLKSETHLNEREIKNKVGDRLKEHKIYRNMLNEEGKRCWTLDYNEFHMDILPCVPNERHYIEPYLTEIKLTHKVSEDYYIHKYSNPYKYRKWFEERMQIHGLEIRKNYARENNIDVDKVPLYKIKTPLQQAIQLLKRHRDVMYEALPQDRKDDAPISIIITTLAAQAYNNESNLYEALRGIIENMTRYIKRINDRFVILNPVMNEENFAEKWNEKSEKAKEFFAWLDSAKRDILYAPIDVQGLNNVAEKLSVCFGVDIVRKSLIDEGNTTRTARENKSLYIDGLMGGLCDLSMNTTKRVGGHTFFGS